MFTLRSNQPTRKPRGVSGTDMPAVRTDNSDKHKPDYRRRNAGKRKRQFPNDLAQRAGVPPAAAQDRLLTPGAGIARRLRAHPARLSRFVAKNSGPETSQPTRQPGPV
jgi:hypothetical protein